MHYSPRVPCKYKRNAITGELHRAKKIVLDFDKETKRIRSKYTQDTQNMLLKTLSRIVTKRKMSF